MQTLQDIIDAVETMPEHYGHGTWFAIKGKQACPLAKEVLLVPMPPDGKGLTVIEWSRLVHSANITRAAWLLGCSQRHITSFTRWWDSLCERAHVPPFDYYDLAQAKRAGNTLRKNGYRVPDEREMVSRMRAAREKECQRTD